MSNVNSVDIMFAAALEEAEAAAKVAVAKALEPYGSQEPALHMECGFAWVKVNDARIPFVRYLKRQLKALGYKYDSSGNLRDLQDGFARSTVPGTKELGSPHWKKGWEFWNPGNFNGQWMPAKYAGAVAFAEVLTGYGIECSAGCRLD